MSVFGDIIGSGIGAFGSIFGGISASKAIKEVKENLKEQERKNASWYERRYNEDATQRGDAQAVLARTEESIKKRNKQAAGAQAVMGGTEESVAATKAANNDALATVASNIAVNGEARKDAIESQYQQNEAGIEQQLNDLERGKAAQIAQATKQVAQVGANIADLI